MPRRKTGSKSKGTNIHIPFYTEGGFNIPVGKEIELKITGTEEEQEKIREMIEPKLPSASEQIRPITKGKKLSNSEEKIVKPTIHKVELEDGDGNKTVLIDNTKPKRKRGRKAKKKEKK